MQLYRVTFNEVDYDQYDAFVVAAESAESAVAYLRDHHVRWNHHDPDHPGTPLAIDWDGGYTVQLVAPTEPGIILASFNAG